MNEPPKKTNVRVDDAQIARSLSCTGCSYDVRGLRIGGRCPECGRPVWDSVLDRVDPAARRLPILRNPRRVGNGLIGLTILALLGTILLLARQLTHTEFSKEWSDWIPRGASLLAAVVLLAGLWPVLKLAPPMGKEPRGAVGRDIWMLSAGLAAMAGLCVWIWWVDNEPAVVYPPAVRASMERTRTVLNLLIIGGAILALYAFRDVMRVIGERSREYRTARGSRQRLRDMLAAAAGIAIGELLVLVGLLTNQDDLQTIGRVVAWISAFMLVIGLGYLVVNAWGIRRSLRRPPPTIRELLTPIGELPPSSTTDPREHGVPVARGEGAADR